MITPGIINIGNIFGSIACLYIMSRCAFGSFFSKLKAKFLSRRSTKILWRTAQTFVVLFVVYAVTVSSAMIYFSTIAPAEDATVITLGAKVNQGKEPSRALSDRINACYDYLVENPDVKAVLSGGQGDNEDQSEAQCMYDILVKKGIEKDRLIIEDKSSDTDENIRFSYDKIKENGCSENIAIATDSYHQLRARIIAGRTIKNGSIGAVNANTYLGIFPTYFVREWFAIPVELLKGW